MDWFQIVSQLFFNQKEFRLKDNNHLVHEISPSKGQMHFKWNKNFINKGIFRFFILLLFSCSVMSNSLHPHELQHTRFPCPSPSPGACSNSCPLSRRCHPSVICHPLLLPSIFPSIRVFSNESAFHIMWPKYCSFSFSISPFSEYSGLISFKID